MIGGGEALCNGFKTRITKKIEKYNREYNYKIEKLKNTYKSFILECGDIDYLTLKPGNVMQMSVFSNRSPPLNLKKTSRSIRPASIGPASIRPPLSIRPPPSVGNSRLSMIKEDDETAGLSGGRRNKKYYNTKRNVSTHKKRKGRTTTRRK